MTFFRNKPSAFSKWKTVGFMRWTTLLLTAGCFLTVRAALTPWAENVAAGSALEAAFFRMMRLPAGDVFARRPPSESRDALTSLVAKTPQQSDLYALRAQEEERLLDPAAAEADWKKAADLAADKTAAFLDLAHFYHRRIQPQQEFEALLHAGIEPSTSRERFTPPEATASYQAFADAVKLVASARLGTDDEARAYTAWMTRWPQDPGIAARYFEALIAAKRATEAQALLDKYRQQHPSDKDFRVIGQAELAGLAQGPQQELAVYDHEFTPLWPDRLAARYFQLLADRHLLRSFLASARTQVAAQPAAIAPALRIFFYYDQQKKPDPAEVALLEFSARHETAHAPWSAEDLRTLGLLFERLRDYDEAARAWYSLYSLSGASADSRTFGLAKLAQLLLLVPEQKLRIGNRDLSLYANIGQMDRHPGFLNGILSLALNSTYPNSAYTTQGAAAVSYFHRAAASDLIERLKKEAPQSPLLPSLISQLLSAYAVYGEDDAIISRAPDFLNRYPTTPEAVDVGLLLGDAYHHKNEAAVFDEKNIAARTAYQKNEQAEFALYDRLLADYAARSEHIPLGPSVASGGVAATQGEEPPAGSNATAGQGDTAAVGNAPERLDQLKSRQVAPTVRSLAYQRVLDRYLSRLTELHRLRDALTLYRREIDHNPDDPGLYERLAAFIEQNRFDSELEPLYRSAMNKFPGSDWPAKLARYYLRVKRDQDYRALVAQLSGVFTGSELESFLSEVPPNAGLNDAFAVSINEFAHAKFPHNLTFVRNLLAHYGSTRSTARSPIKYATLLRQNWFYAPDLRGSFFALLVESGHLNSELAALPKTEDSAKSANLAALAFAAEGYAWLTHYEAAAPSFTSLSHLAPGDALESDRAISVNRSLADLVPGSFDRAVALSSDAIRRDPSSHQAITRLGEIYADREQYAKAAPFWDQLAKTSPGLADVYLEAATVFWDYFQFDDALRLLHLGRTNLHDDSLYAYEAGAIYENKGDIARAIGEYVRGVLNHDADNNESQRRLITLGRRKSTHDLVEKASLAALTSGNAQAADLRLALLENQGRTAEIAQLLEAEVDGASSTERLATLRATAARFHLTSVEERALTRTVSLSTDPVEKLEARLDVASFREGRKDAAGAETDLSGLLRDNPTILGVLRANVDFYVRAGQPGRAVPVLEAAAGRAVEPYRRDLLREAAAKAADAGDFPEARRVLGQLLASDPYNGDLLATVASTYARQGDDQELAAFYRRTLDALNQAPLAPQEKTNRIAALRRGYIDALVKLSRYPDALDQSIEILNRFPEDAALANETAHFAEAHGLADRLTGYYEKTSTASPKDYRWPLVLARVDRALRRYPESIAALEKASIVRPDRPDLLVDKADLETRLLRFDDALKTNQRLYELTYHDTSYLVAQAEIHARLGHRQDALKLVRQAMIDGRQKAFENYSSAAHQLAGWNLLAEAKTIWEEGLPLIAGHEAEHAAEFGEYLQLLAELRQWNEAFAKAVAVDTTKEHAAARQWADAIGEVVARYYAPEEKAQLAQAVSGNKLPSVMNTTGLLASAQLNDLLAQRQYAELSAHPLNAGLRQALVKLEGSQLRYAALARQFEAIAKTAAGDNEARVVYLSELQQIYRALGNTAAEMREYDALNQLRDIDRQSALIAGAPDHYPDHIHDNDRGRLIAAYLVATTDESRASAALHAASHPATKLWLPAYQALTGLYWNSASQAVKDSFTLLMGPRTVGEQLSQKAAWDQHLTGETWFYYGASYGEYLLGQKQNGADVLPAGLEGSASASNRYIELGDVYRDHGHADQARLEFATALQLSPKRPEIVDRLAQIDWEAGRKPEAIGEWKQSFDLLKAIVLNGGVQPSFWITARNVLIEANRNRIVAEIKSAADAMFQQYVHINGGYNLMPFIAGILTDAPDRDAAMSWVISLTSDPRASSVLSDLLYSNLLTVSDKDAVFREQLRRAQQRESHPDLSDETYFPPVASVKTMYAQFLDANGRYAEAWQLLSSLRQASNSPQNMFYDDVFLHAAVLSGHLDSILAEYGREPGRAPLDMMTTVAGRLKNEGHTKEANQLLEFVYSTQLASPAPPVTAYFGMAALRLEQKRNNDALALLRDVTLRVGAPFENLAQAVHLLEESDLTQEAAAYATEWHKSTPWNTDAALAAARLNHSTADLTQILAQKDATYSVRVDAALALRVLHGSTTGTTELDLLTRQTISSAQAELPYAADLRLAAAAQTTEIAAKIRLLEGAISIRPELVEPRRDLALAELQARHDRLAVTAYESLNLPSAPDFEVHRYYVSRPVQAAMSEAERTLIEQIAGAYRRLQEPTLALALYNKLLANSPLADQRKRAEQARNEISDAMRLLAANQLRAPLVLPAIQQPRAVRPRLTTPPPLSGDDAEPGSQEGGAAQ